MSAGTGAGAVLGAGAVSGVGSEWAELDAAIDAYICEHELAPRTVAEYQRFWVRWERFCSERGFPALGAPFEAYVSFFAAAGEGRFPTVPAAGGGEGEGRGSRGNAAVSRKPLSLSAVNSILAAVRHRHEREGVVAVFDSAGFAGEFQVLRRGYARAVNGARVRKRQAKPLRAADVRALMAVEPGWVARDLVRAALVLVSLDAGWGEDRVFALTSSHVTTQHVTTRHATGRDSSAGAVSEAAAGADGGSRVTGVRVVDPCGSGSSVVFACTCGDSSGDALTAAVPVVCTACLLTEACAAVGDEEPDAGTVPLLLRVYPKRYVARDSWRARLASLAGSWRELEVTSEGGVRYRSEGLPEWVVRGTRLGVVESSRDGVSVRAGQARVVLSWRLAWRSADEPARLLRRHLTLTSTPSWLSASEGSGISDAAVGVEVRAHLPSSKTDQGGGGVDFVAASGTVNLGSARIVQWAALVDAMAGSSPDTPLFCSTRRHGITRASETLTPGDWRTVFRDLQARAGLTGFTPHSTRVGFAVTATEHGHSELDIQDSMRLRTPSLLQRYARQARNSRTPVDSLTSALDATGTSARGTSSPRTPAARNGNPRT